ncbi:D-arabinono-1,4-lactone oxidase [Cellulosimicrobium marinum]|uniref:D-arabinono-1,4-lactone oxidase n=1 Tax=Cellulosimicrobium marinum TaxID=1638992 RepID=UPI001E5B39D7|nr:D-arabinono-1,4-lactone oxidase [Cellulosimicrobium marinum]MCB7136895.1 FAD-binding protein [Cellulosimicrobium marinum]
MSSDATLPWTNWARTATATPRRRASPHDEADLAAHVARAAGDGLRVRAVGAGHSFTPAAVTDGLLLDLDRVSLVERIGREGDALHVTVGAGIRLHRLNAALDAAGLAMRNLGDIDRQSVAGAISTGTHGTGARLGGLATQVRGVRVVGADGQVREASPTQDPDLFEASRLGLGTTGVLSAVTLEVVPAFLLRAQEEPWPLDRVLDGLAAADDDPDGLVGGNDHVEFYWFPHTRRALTKRNNRLTPDEEAAELDRLRTAGPGAVARARTWLDEELLSNGAFELVNRIATAVPRATPRLNAVSARALAPRTYVAPSHQVFVTSRRVRFREMEYAVPREHLVDVLTAIDAWLETSGEHVPFPVEVRFAAADDVWLSTAHGRPTAYVAVHQYARLDHRRYFDAVEAIVAEVGGRPHWGKLHGLDAARLRELYPRFDAFVAVRDAVDPQGVFANDYVDRVLGTAPGPEAR